MLSPTMLFANLPDAPSGFEFGPIIVTQAERMLHSATRP
jgi:hypothetical protein